uniref:RCC1/BLIP-II n=1 Tax=Steinernema glaseri TaxID=37863 RepID=A0A1I8A6D0_9BILA
MKATTKKVGRPVKRKAGEQSPKKVPEVKEAPVAEQVEPTTSRTKRVKHVLLTQDSYVPKFAAERVLSCGEGPQLGHPKRNTTKKPRHVSELPEGLKFAQAVAGGVHSFLLTTDGQVYGCGVNEKGTVPVDGLDRGGSTNKFKLLQFPERFRDDKKIIMLAAGARFTAALTEKGTVYAWGYLQVKITDIDSHSLFQNMQEEPTLIYAPILKRVVKIAAGENHLLMLSEDGEIVMLAAGASFTAALTEKGTVYAWGNLRDASGNIDSHSILQDMQKEPTLINNYKSTHVVKIAAGENHLLMLSNNGEVLSFGDGTQGQLGRTMRTSHIRSNYMVDSSGNSRRLVINLREKARKENRAVDIMAGGYWSMVKVEDGRWFAFGLNNYGQLGVPLPKEADEPGAAGDTMQVDETDYHVYLPTLAAEYSSVDDITDIQGVQHTVCRSVDGTVHAMGKNTDNALGLDTWTGNDDNEHWRYTSLQKVPVPVTDGDSVVGVTATIGCSIAWTENGDAFAWGCDTVVINLREKADKENTAVDIMAGGYWSMVKLKDGRWFAFGLNDYGQIGVPLPKETDPSSSSYSMRASDPHYHVYLPTPAAEYSSVDNITHIQGVQHTVCRSSDGTVHALGKNTHNALGLNTWTGNDENGHWRYTSLQKVSVGDGDSVAGVTAAIGCSIAWTENGDAFAWGRNTVGQLGLGVTNGDAVPSPDKIVSNHLEGFKIVYASIADKHALVLATKKEEEDSSIGGLCEMIDAADLAEHMQQD